MALPYRLQTGVARAAILMARVIRSPHLLLRLVMTLVALLGQEITVLPHAVRLLDALPIRIMVTLLLARPIFLIHCVVAFVGFAARTLLAPHVRVSGVGRIACRIRLRHRGSLRVRGAFREPSPRRLRFPAECHAGKCSLLQLRRRQPLPRSQTMLATHGPPCEAPQTRHATFCLPPQQLRVLLAVPPLWLVPVRALVWHATLHRRVAVAALTTLSLACTNLLVALRRLGLGRCVGPAACRLVP
mmetsp:Transcript_33347/g.80473  ORF Transcript_33347/g.80473 Transcript_33347/m.80473 type:complete len:244 (-) Transcript_33347:627-1358(-)